MIGFLFDLDGVIIDSESRYTEIWGEIDSRFHTGVADFVHKIKGCTLEHILSTYFRPEDHDAVVGILKAREKEMAYDYCPGACTLLEEIVRSPWKAALVTSSNDAKMARLYAQHPEIRSYFVKIIDGNMVSRSKPDPEGYLMGAEAIGAVPGRCVVFEDSLQGVKAGKAAGAYTVGVAGTLPAEVLAPVADRVVPSLEEIDFNEIVDIQKNR